MRITFTSPTTPSFPTAVAGEAELVARVGDLMGELIETHHPDLIVIPCNTASTLVLPHLRTRFRVPFVGTVPAIKPACAVSRTKRVAVLGTQATVSREYTRGFRGGGAQWRAGCG
jgi:glutamate racemase